MPASVTNDKFLEIRNGGAPLVTTVSSSRSIGGTSLSCVALTNWSTTTAVPFITYKKTATGAVDNSTIVSWMGVVSSNTITSMVLQNGTDAGNAIGDYVAIVPTSEWANKLYEGLIVSHNTDGTMKSSLSLTTPKIITSLNDTNGNELFKLTATSSAVNEITIANAATGSSPSLTATGSDTNINLTLTGKGTGGVLTKNPYMFSATASGPSALPSATATKLQFGNELYDISSNFDSTTNYRFTAPVAGYYSFTGQYVSQVNGSGSNTRSFVSLYKNGSELRRGIDTTTPNGGFPSSTVTETLQLAANDYVELWAYASPGINIDTNWTKFSGFFVSV